MLGRLETKFLIAFEMMYNTSHFMTPYINIITIPLGPPPETPVKIGKLHICQCKNSQQHPIGQQ